MEKKNESWVPGPDDTLESLVAQQRRTVEDFAKQSGVSFPRLTDIIEVDHTEIVEQSMNGSKFIKVVRKFFRMDGNGSGNRTEGEKP